MKTLKVTLLLALLLGACTDQDATTPCGAGDQLNVGNTQLCVWKAGIIENGFRCPMQRPFRHNFGELVVCSAQEELSEAQKKEIRRIYITTETNDVSEETEVTTEACFEVIPSTIDFGIVALGESRMESFTINNCGTEPIEVPNISITGDPSSLFSLPDLTMLPLTLEPGASVSITVAFTPISHGTFEAILTVESSTQDQPIISMLITGQIPNDCPVPMANQNEFEVAPLETIILDGSVSHSPKGDLVSYEWSVITRPEGSTSVLERIIQDQGLARRQFFIDLAGTYQFRLDVEDETGASSRDENCEPYIVTVHSVPCCQNNLHIQLIWHIPDAPEETTDLDLHLVKLPEGSWFDNMWDCYYANIQPSWGGNDPSLDIDSVDDNGPENINMTLNNNCNWYAVGVHHFSNDRPNAMATIRIYMGEVHIYEYENKELSGHDFWDVLRFHASGEIFVVDEIYEGNEIRNTRPAITDEIINSQLCGLLRSAGQPDQ